MERITAEVLERFLKELGARIPQPALFYLMGGSALILLGSTRETLDVDYLIPALNEATKVFLAQLSNELRLDLEFVAIDEFIPLPLHAQKRHRFIGHYGQVDVYIFDPYSIALSKLDRGFDTDIEDILFLLQRRLIALRQLEDFMETALLKAREFDIDANAMRQHLQAVKSEM